MKNVLSIVSYQFLPAKMGGQKGIAYFNRFFSKYVQLTCVTTQNNDINFAPEYEVLNVLSNSKLRYINISYFFKLKKLIKKKKITHLLLEHPYYGWLGILIQRFCKVKLVVHSHNIETERFKSTGKWWWRILAIYEKLTYTKADCCFFINDEDKAYAIQHFNIAKEKCYTITYGFELQHKPKADEKAVAKDFIRRKHNISEQEKIILFNGTLNYNPNRWALDIILQKINPILLAEKDYQYSIIICGKNLPEEYNDLLDYKDKNIVFAGFVDDIIPYFAGADVFINPVIDGGGIKTKIVEALGFNINVVTTLNGAIGVPLSVTGEKMKIVANDNWDQFAKEMINTPTNTDIPQSFFDHFYWDEIVKKAAQAL